MLMSTRQPWRQTFHLAVDRVRFDVLDRGGHAVQVGDVADLAVNIAGAADTHPGTSANRSQNQLPRHRWS